MGQTLFLCLIFMQVGFVILVNVTYSCLSNTTCGCSRNSAALTRIVGGESAKHDTWGWAVSVCKGNNHICGGSLISSTLVLTAAHCLVSIKSMSTLRINIGSKNLSTIRQQRNVSNVYIHQNYDSNSFANDIAMIRLESSVNISDRSIALICLPSIVDKEYPPAGESVVAIGWGVLLADDKKPSELLQQVTLNVISNSVINCHNSINNNDIQFCAGVQGGGKDTCQGDSGGPLMLFSNGQWILVGITSYGTGCALAEHPGVYTRVSYYQEWISCFLSDNTSCIDKAEYQQKNFLSTGVSIFYKNIFVFFFCFVILNLSLSSR